MSIKQAAFAPDVPVPNASFLAKNYNTNRALHPMLALRSAVY